MIKIIKNIVFVLLAFISLMVFCLIEFPLSPLMVIFILFKKEPFDADGNIKLPMFFLKGYFLLMIKTMPYEG